MVRKSLSPTQQLEYDATINVRSILAPYPDYNYILESIQTTDTDAKLNIQASGNNIIPIQANHPL